MSVISITKLYDLLSGKFGKEAAENLTTFVESTIDQKLESKIDIFATKQDVFAIRQDLFSVKEDLLTQIAKVDSKVDSKVGDLVKWMFIFWIGQVAATVSFVLLYIRK